MHSVADTFEFPTPDVVVALLRTPNSSFGQSHSLDVFNAGCQEDAQTFGVLAGSVRVMHSVAKRMLTAHLPCW